MPEYQNEEYQESHDQGFGGLDEHEIMEIQAEYRRQKMKENIIGPVISTMVHVTLLVLCAVFFQGEVVYITQVAPDVDQCTERWIWR